MLSKVVGPKYASIFKAWVPTLSAWGAVSALTLVHFTDWRVVMDYVPYINGKFKKED